MIDQKKHIESLIGESTQREKKLNRIQELYVEYTAGRSETVFSELIQLIDGFTLPWVRRHLWSADCYSDENENQAMQEARIAVWNSMLDIDRQGGLNSNFAYYAFGIYKKKTLDVIRKESRNRARYHFTSIDEHFGDEETKTAEILPPFIEDYGEREKIRVLYDKVFRLYCSAFMNTKTFPPRCLALYYARVLPHLLSEIPDSKAASAKWAMERMGRMSIDMLTIDSERTLRKDIDDNLVWGEPYIDQINEKWVIDGKDRLLKTVIYTDVYDKGKTEDWAEYMHKAALKEACRRMAGEPELAVLVKEYASSETTLQRFLKGK